MHAGRRGGQARAPPGSRPACSPAPRRLCVWASCCERPHFSCRYVVLGFSRQQHSCPKRLKTAFLPRPGSFTYERASPVPSFVTQTRRV